MLRIIASAVVGYIVIFVCIFALFSGLYLALGAEGAFQPGSYQVSMLWIVISTVLSFAAAVAGGWVSRAVARSQSGPRALAVLVLALGLIMAASIAASPPPPAVRDAALSNMEAMGKAQTPLWMAVLNPFLGAAGVLLGGRLKKETPAAIPSDGV
jgi:hypothetical protein